MGFLAGDPLMGTILDASQTEINQIHSQMVGLILTS